MKLQLKFDEIIYRKQIDLLFEMGYGKKKRYYKNSNYFGIVLIILGALAIIGKGNIGYVFIMIGLYLLLSYHNYYYKQKKLLLKLKAEQLQIIAYYKENSNASFEFNENELVFSNHNSSTKIDWQEFDTVIEKEENIFLITKKFIPIIFGKSEVGIENYNLALEFIESKLGKKTSR